MNIVLVVILSGMPCEQVTKGISAEECDDGHSDVQFVADIALKHVTNVGPKEREVSLSQSK